MKLKVKQLSIPKYWIIVFYTNRGTCEFGTGWNSSNSFNSLHNPTGLINKYDTLNSAASIHKNLFSLFSHRHPLFHGSETLKSFVVIGSDTLDFKEVLVEIPINNTHDYKEFISAYGNEDEVTN